MRNFPISFWHLPGLEQRVVWSGSTNRDEAVLAERVLAAVSEPLLYARIDVARDENQKPLLMELELIEPSLFLDHAVPAIARRFAQAIARRL